MPPRPRAVIGIAGGTCSGKTRLAQRLRARLGASRCVMLGMDSYYFGQGMSPHTNSHKDNFDHPSSVDFDLLADHLFRLRNGQSVEVPIYDRGTSRRLGAQTTESAEFLIVEGLFALWSTSIRSMLDLRVFLHVDADVRLVRRIMRDVLDYHLSLQECCTYYLDVVRMMHMEFVEPSRVHADLVLTDELDEAGHLSIMLSHIRRVQT